MSEETVMYASERACPAALGVEGEPEYDREKARLKQAEGLLLLCHATLESVADGLCKAVGGPTEAAVKAVLVRERIEAFLIPAPTEEPDAD